MPNLIPQVDALIKEQAKGWPDGTNNLYRQVPVLLQRIHDLEQALIPFAKVWMNERTNPAVTPEFVAGIYIKHCKTAFDQLDQTQGTAIRHDDFFNLPAQ